ncbi:hypothetical protein Ddc_06982 [Ditylenchus destructor]|nr:hypothetical protein Ddc_06982 [Ditylenchus destructor]
MSSEKSAYRARFAFCHCDHILNIKPLIIIHEGPPPAAPPPPPPDLLQKNDSHEESAPVPPQSVVMNPSGTPGTSVPAPVILSSVNQPVPPSAQSQTPDVPTGTSVNSLTKTINSLTINSLTKKHAYGILGFWYTTVQLVLRHNNLQIIWEMTL